MTRFILKITHRHSQTTAQPPKIPSTIVATLKLLVDFIVCVTTLGDGLGGGGDSGVGLDGFGSVGLVGLAGLGGGSGGGPGGLGGFGSGGLGGLGGLGGGAESTVVTYRCPTSVWLLPTMVTPTEKVPPPEMVSDDPVMWSENAKPSITLLFPTTMFSVLVTLLLLP